jgi:predicted  nucleic acid-binding Zn-ribbon protein
MWKSLCELVRTVLSLGEYVQEDREEIKEIRKDLRDLTLVVERLVAQVEHVGEREQREREMLVLRLENSLLRSPRAVLVADTDGGLPAAVRALPSR